MRQQLLDQVRRAVDALFSSASAAARAASSGARSTSSTCSFSAASGVRSSCAASAVKRRCAFSASSRRASSALRLPASGRSSSRQSGFGQRRHRVGLALGHGARHRLERAQAAADGIPDEHAEKRNQRGQRQQRAQRRLRGDLAPLVQRVRDLQRVAAFDVRVDAPRAAVAHDVAVPFRRRHGQAGAGTRPVDEHAVAVPDLRDDFGHARGAPAVAGPTSSAAGRAAGRRCGSNTRAASAAGRRVRRSRAGCRSRSPTRRQHGDRGQAEQQPHQQRPADRRHAAPRRPTSALANQMSPRRGSSGWLRRRASCAGCGRALRRCCFPLPRPSRTAAPPAAPWTAPCPAVPATRPAARIRAPTRRRAPRAGHRARSRDRARGPPLRSTLSSRAISRRSSARIRAASSSRLKTA